MNRSWLSVGLAACSALLAAACFGKIAPLPDDAPSPSSAGAEAESAPSKDVPTTTTAGSDASAAGAIASDASTDASNDAGPPVTPVTPVCSAAVGGAACANGGICDVTGGSATCVCRSRFTGPTCDVACAADRAGPSCAYRLVYGVDIPNAASWKVPANVPYDKSNAAGIGAFTRVGYRLVLDTEEVFVELDAFTANAAKLGIPVNDVFDVDVTKVVVRAFAANQKSILTESDGHLELWSHCYGAGADGVFDDDDHKLLASPDCHGSFQVHVGARTIFAINNWASGGTIALGIGPRPVGAPDWTYAANAALYGVKRLEVYAK